MLAQDIPCITISEYALGVGESSDWTAEPLAKPEATNHAWNEVWVDGRWVIVDTTWDSCARYGGKQFSDGPTRYTYFDPSIEIFSSDHRTVERGTGQVEEPASWAKEGVNYITSLGVGKQAVMGDSGGGLFNPTGTYTQEEAMVSALRLWRCVSP